RPGCRCDTEVKTMGHGGNVIDELVTDHREVEELFGKIEALPPRHKDRKLYADQATIELVRHSVAEAAYLYPAERAHVANGDALADRELQDHPEAEQMMKDLEGCDAGDAEFDRLIGMRMTENRARLADQEQTLFPLLRAACGPEGLDRLGDKIRQAKKTAPTRPHPAAPDRPAAIKLLAPGAGLVDRLRDALSGRGKAD